MRLAVKAAAVNPTDIVVRERGVEGFAPPWVPGMDAAGLVESLEQGASNRLAVGGGGDGGGGAAAARRAARRRS